MRRRDFIKAAGVLAGSTVAVQQIAGTKLFASLRTSTSRPNVLFVITDQQSAEAMSCRMGNRFINTPAMDSIAANGVSFSRAYTSNPLCVPARTSIFTGYYPHQTGVQTNVDISKPVVEKFRCLGQYFRDAGYETGYFGKWHMALPVKDIAVHGFESMGAIKNNGIDKELPQLATEFIYRKREKPFFLVTSFVNPHNICEWARGEELPDGTVGEPPPVDHCPPLVENHSPMINETDTMILMRRSAQANRLFPVGNFDEKKWREYRWAYFRMIERVDVYLATILQALRESHQDENTVVVFTSDHGDMQGAHRWNQKTVLYDNSTRVPLIVSAPGMRKGGVSERLVITGIDLLPTLCALAGIGVSEALPGVSLIPSVRNPELSDSRKFIVVQNKMIQGSPIDGEKPEPAGRMVRSRRFKYCVYDIGKQRESFIDMEHDPGETENLAGKPEYQQELKEHRQFLAQWCRETNDSFVVPIE